MSAAPGEPPVFVNKLIAMIENPGNSALIRWAPKGETFIVTDADRLAELELPKYFKHSNFTSLVRQLNMYGFHKVTNTGGSKSMAKSEPQLWEFVHPCVQRGRPELLVHVKRKASESSGSKKKMPKEDVSNVLVDMMALREANLKLKQKFEAVQRQNEALWKEIAEHRHRHAQQQWKIERIMKYINALYVNREAGASFGMPSTKKGRSMSAPSESVEEAEAAEIIARAEALADRRATPYSESSLRESSDQIAKELMIPDLHHPTGHPNEGEVKAAHEVHKALETHLGEYDTHLDRHQAHLEKHLDDHFMASIFNPPHGAELLRGTDSMDATFQDSAFNSSEGKDVPHRGMKRTADAMSADEELLNAMEIFTPLHEYISDAVVPE